MTIFANCLEQSQTFTWVATRLRWFAVLRAPSSDIQLGGRPFQAPNNNAMLWKAMGRKSLE